MNLATASQHSCPKNTVFNCKIDKMKSVFSFVGYQQIDFVTKIDLKLFNSCKYRRKINFITFSKPFVMPLFCAATNVRNFNKSHTIDNALP